MFNTIRDQTVCANSQSALLLCQGTGAGGGGGGGSSSSSVLTSTSISTSDSLLTSTSTSTSSSLISSCFLTRTGPTGSGAESSYSGSGISPPWVTRDEVTVAHLGESSMNKFGQVWSSFHEQNASKKHSPHMLSCWPRAFGPCRKNLTGLKVMSIQNYTWLVQQKYKTWWIHVRRPIGNKRKLRKKKQKIYASKNLSSMWTATSPSSKAVAMMAAWRLNGRGWSNASSKSWMHWVVFIVLECQCWDIIAFCVELFELKLWRLFNFKMCLDMIIS